MLTIIVGLGIQGKKRKTLLGNKVVATVDPVNPDANYTDVSKVPLESYQCAFLCVPEEAKISLITWFLTHKKHVLVEKPLMFHEEEEIRKIETLSKERNCICYTAYNHRFEPHILKMKEVVSSGVLGKLYSLRMFYGNGTAREVRESAWRDRGMGILADLGSHLLDTLLFVLGEERKDLDAFELRCLENKSPDFMLVGSSSKQLPRISLEATFLSWRNTFYLDIIAEKGSAHIQGLCKWGPSIFSLRTRVLPSGKPKEECLVLEEPDPTWRLEHEYFETLCQKGHSDLKNDIWINNTLRDLFSQGVMP